MDLERARTIQLGHLVDALADDMRPATRAGLQTFRLLLRGAEVCAALASLGYAPALGVGWCGYTDVTIPVTMGLLTVGFTGPFFVGDAVRRIVYRRLLRVSARTRPLVGVGGLQGPVALRPFEALNVVEDAEQRMEAARNRPRPPAPPLVRDDD